MPLTTPQLAVLKADINADPALAALPQNDDTAFDLAAIYNRPAAQPFFVWRRSVSVADIMGNGFDWTRVDNLTVGRARIWEFMTALGVLNPSQANVRSGISAAFNQGADAAMRLAIFSHCQQQATRAEKLFSTGLGASVDAAGVGPATVTISDPITLDDVRAARSLP